MRTITATYSPEDNKIRLYASTRLDAETYERVKAAGFKWAPKQELFVAPKWTPSREDLALELAGEIEPEEMTLAERAMMKAERLEALAGKKLVQSGAYQRAAQELSEAFYMGQPILVGHHSERKARRTKERMDSAQEKAIKLAKSSNYWLYRATGVECYANMKNDPRVRAGRIKTLLAELRDVQRRINEAHKRLAIWEKATSDEQITYIIGNTNVAYGLYSDLTSGKITAQEAREKAMAGARNTIQSDNYKRWIDHILNRLAFEREMLGEVARYEGELTPVILQAFAREHGADKPAASIIDDGYMMLESPVPLPLHIGEGMTWAEKSLEEWRNFMQATGYEVPAAKPRRVSSKPAPAPLINPTAEQAEQLQRIWNLQMVVTCKASGRAAVAEENSVTALTQAVYSANSGGSYSPLETVEIDASGRRIQRVGGYSAQWDDEKAEPVARIRVYSRGTGFYKPRSVVHISDKPAKALPIDLDTIERATLQAIEDAGQPATLGGAPFDASRLKIRRRRSSTSQGEVELYYNGRKLSRYGDMIRLVDGQYQGHSDDYWREVAERDLIKAAQEVAA
jgi:hypothetical protein